MKEASHSGHGHGCEVDDDPAKVGDENGDHTLWRQLRSDEDDGGAHEAILAAYGKQRSTSDAVGLDR